MERRTIHEILEGLAVSKATFSKMFGIPHGTVSDWDKGRTTPAPYIVDLIEFKLAHSDREDGLKYGVFYDVVANFSSLDDFKACVTMALSAYDHALARYIYYKTDVLTTAKLYGLQGSEIPSFPAYEDAKKAVDSIQALLDIIEQHLDDYADGHLPFGFEDFDKDEARKLIEDIDEKSGRVKTVEADIRRKVQENLEKI